MNILTIDTSTTVEMIAVSKDGRVSDKTTRSGVSHSITLFDHVNAGLSEQGLTVKDIELIGVGLGPGSFTGIRIAVSTARMLAQLLSVPLVGIHSQLFYAVSVPALPGDAVLVAFDAKKGRVFGGLYMETDNPLLPETLIPPADLPLEYLLQHTDKDVTIHLVGNGITRYYGEHPRSENHIMRNDLVPSGKASCDLTALLYSRKPLLYTDFNTVVPLYARKSDAEVVLKNNQKHTRGR